MLGWGEDVLSSFVESPLQVTRGMTDLVQSTRGEEAVWSNMLHTSPLEEHFFRPQHRMGEEASSQGAPAKFLFVSI